ncbi:hypothetical protein CFC21_060769 [Triticum aestivum]|uniref:Uncharacterized protein n=2 Tax=Triticum aestivum TaxID=4565 RepID=A0A3B6JFG0_WHEAT|nr:uncharacterized protein LOC109758943 [Aegilops tauschii subsp. strangulata]XP_044373700.1 uncharacterized protein LOC123096142 [Triticum aestivum]KAF7052707.1 hypothetical protein CFC21_060769 [Triticum aestivum]
MAQWISSTPCDASGCEATEEAPLLDVEKGVPEEHATASPADDGGVEATKWLSCRRFFQVFLAVVWLYMVNQMRIAYNAYDDDETRPFMVFLLVVMALSVANVFLLFSTQPLYPPAQSASVLH